MKSPVRSSGSRGALTGILALLLAITLTPTRAEDEDLHARSLPLRTALHHDPTLEGPLERLTALYREAGRLEDLLEVYRGHLAQYPQDDSARIVLIRLLSAVRDPEALRLARAAAESHADHAYFRWLLATLMRQAGEPGALAEMDRAITLESTPEQRARWIEDLLPEAAAADRRDLAEKHLRALADLPGATPDSRLQVARRLIDVELPEAALAVLEAAAGGGPAPETGVEIDLAAAAAEAALDRREAAGARLEQLLGRLAADHWRRSEIARRRFALARGDAERATLVVAARARVVAAPADEAAALDLASCLAALERRREALEALLEAGRRLPASVRLEKETLELYDRLRDERGRERYLAARLQACPERRDLARARTRCLFLLGRRTEAQATLAAATEGATPTERTALLVDLGRELRRSGATSDAATVFDLALAAAPERFDLRRETAEALLALGERTRARRLFAAAAPEGTAPDAVLEAVRFLVAQGMLAEARAMLAPLLAGESSAIETLLVGADLEGRLGERAAGETALARARALADTAPRYALWLEAAASFAERFQDQEGFLAREGERIAAESGWSASRVERLLAWVDAAARNGPKANAIAFLGGFLESDAPAEAKTSLRRRAVELMADDPARGGDFAAQLETMAAEDPEHSDTWRARLAVLHARAQRQDLAQPLASSVRPAAISDPGLLAELAEFYREWGDGERLRASVTRLTEVDPSRRSAWESLITTLALAGDEPRLRATIRRVLQGIEGLEMKEAVAETLRAHLVDSYWRSFAVRIASGKTAGLEESLLLLDEAERASREPEQAVWTAWARAWALHRLGRVAERDEALGEVERLAADQPREEGPPAGTAPGTATAGSETPAIRFPDGLSLALAHARTALTAAPVSAPRVGDRVGPLPPFRVRWAFDTGGAPLAWVEPVAPDRVLVGDQQGGLACLDLARGKLRWEIAGVGSQSSHPPPASDGQRVFVSRGGAVHALAIRDGRCLWQAQGSSGPARDGWRVFLHGPEVLAVDPAAGAIATFDQTTGKLLRELLLFGQDPAGGAVPGSATTGGAFLQDDRLLVYGRTTAVLDVRTLQPLWWLEPGRLRDFPVKLDEEQSTPSVDPRMAKAGGVVIYSRGIRRGSSGAHRMIPMQAALILVHAGRAAGTVVFLPPNTPVRLGSEAVHWAGAQESLVKEGWLCGNRLVLHGDQGLLALPLDLPIGAMIWGFEGIVLGSVGRLVCAIGADGCEVMDVESGAHRSLPWTGVAAEGRGARVRAAVDGPVVYAVGPAGIAAVNAATGESVFQAEWPEGWIPAEEPAPGNSADAQYEQDGFSRTVAPSIVARVLPGVFLTSVSPTRLVALAGEDQDGR